MQLVVICFNPASAFRHQDQTGTGYGLARHCSALDLSLTLFELMALKEQQLTYSTFERNTRTITLILYFRMYSMSTFLNCLAGSIYIRYLPPHKYNNSHLHIWWGGLLAVKTQNCHSVDGIGLFRGIEPI
jgi:hypothetical protein